MNDPAAVEFEHVFKAFGNRKVLDDVSFKVNAGEALCILGRSGTGKSVTLKLMIGLLKPDSGKVCIDSEDIAHSSEEDLSRVRRHMGFLFQSAALFDSFTLGDNLALPLRRLDKSKSPAEIKRAVDEALERVGLNLDVAKMPYCAFGRDAQTRWSGESTRSPSETITGRRAQQRTRQDHRLGDRRSPPQSQEGVWCDACDRYP